jgi:hypothetical protein
MARSNKPLKLTAAGFCRSCGFRPARIVVASRTEIWGQA